MHSVTSGAVYSALGITWQEDFVSMPSDITSVFNYCKAHFIASRVCAFRITSAGQTSSFPFGTASVTIIYCLSSVNYGWILGLSDKYDCQMAIAYVNASVSDWLPISNIETDEITITYHAYKMKLRKTGKVVSFNLYGDMQNLPAGGWTYIGVLPQKFRPTQDMMFREQTASATAIRILATSGNINIYNYGTQYSASNAFFNGTWITD